MEMPSGPETWRRELTRASASLRFRGVENSTQFFRGGALVRARPRLSLTQLAFLGLNSYLNCENAHTRQVNFKHLKKENCRIMRDFYRSGSLEDRLSRQDSASQLDEFVVKAHPPLVQLSLSFSVAGRQCFNQRLACHTAGRAVLQMDSFEEAIWDIC